MAVHINRDSFGSLGERIGRIGLPRPGHILGEFVLHDAKYVRVRRDTGCVPSYDLVLDYGYLIAVIFGRLFLKFKLAHQ